MGYLGFRGASVNNPRPTLGIAGLIGVVASMACGKDTGKDTAPSGSGPADLDGSVAHGDAAEVPGDDASGPSSDDGAAPVDAGPIVAPQPLSPNIVVDQFGYLPASE